MTRGHSPVLEVVVTARPSWARVQTLLHAYHKIAGATRCRVCLVGPAVSKRYGDITGQMPNDISLKTFPTLRDSDDLSSIALNSIDGSEALARHWKDFRPDCALVIADRTETLGVSSTAALMQIPLIHLQGGETSGSIDDKVRDANSKLADLHLTTNSETRQYLLSIGERDELIKVVGCPSIDLVKRVMESNETWSIPEVNGVGAQILPGSEYGIIMFHPDTLDEKLNEDWVDSLINVVTESDKMWFWFWPNPDFGTSMISKKIRRARELHLLSNVQFVINTTPEIFIKIATQASIMVGNSSFGIRESSFIGLPVVNLGQRQRNRQRGENVTDIVFPSNVNLANAIRDFAGNRYPSSNLYGEGNAGFLAAKAIMEWEPGIKL